MKPERQIAKEINSLQVNGSYFMLFNNKSFFFFARRDKRSMVCVNPATGWSKEVVSSSTSKLEQYVLSKFTIDIDDDVWGMDEDSFDVINETYLSWKDGRIRTALNALGHSS